MAGEIAVPGRGQLTFNASLEPMQPVEDHKRLQGASEPGVATRIARPAVQPVNRLLIQTFAQNIRYTISNDADAATTNDPTAAKGFQLKPTDGPRLIFVSEYAVVKIIQEAGGSDVQYQWFK